MEIERKYLLSGLPDRIEGLFPSDISQFYLSFSTPMVRIRRVDSRGEVSYSLCKKIGAGMVREEEEVGITEECFNLLRVISHGEIVKRRYRIPSGDHPVEIDIFLGEHDGLIIAEREFYSATLASQWQMPDWLEDVLDREVTDDPFFTNAMMAKNMG